MAIPIKDGNSAPVTLRSRTVSGEQVPEYAAYSPSRHIQSRYLSINGDGTGGDQCTGEYVSATEFKLTPAAGEVFHVTRLIGYIEDSAGMDNGKYGNGITLTNGIAVRSQSRGVAENLDGGKNIFTNGQWKRLCYDEHIDASGSGNDSCAFRWTFSKMGDELVLDGDEGDFLKVVLHDDFTALVDHTFLVQFYEEV